MSTKALGPVPAIMRFQRDDCILLGIVFVLVLQARIYKTQESPPLRCPFQCVCSNIATKLLRTQELGLFKLKCGGEGKKIASIMELRLSGRLLEASQLDLSDNNMEHIFQNIFINFTSLQKLDLNKNQISYIEKDAFSSLKRLKRLDLSNNKLSAIHDIFGGLDKLEKLKLNQNLISTIQDGTFNALISLKQLDITGNPLMCNCGILWLLDWARDKSVKLAPPPKCDSPTYLTGQPLRKLKLGSELQCKDNTTALGGLRLQPTESQLVFEGDALSLHCGAPSLRQLPLSWMWGDVEAGSAFTDINIKNLYSPEKGVIESSLHIDHLLHNHTGQWHCHLLSELGNQSQTIAVIVISEHTQYCSQEMTSGSKGVYVWPKTVLGFTSELLCVGEPHNGQQAYRSCKSKGGWSPLNASSCPYISETTKILEQFAKMNLSISRGTILESAKRLKNFTGDGKQLKDYMDVLFTTKTVENYLEFIASEKELGSLLVSIVGSMLRTPREIMTLAQLEEKACSRLVKVIEFTAESIPSLQAHKTGIAVEEFSVKRDTFPGLTCTWYSHGDGGRLFHCSNSNATSLLGSKAKVIEASIQVPASLFYQLELQGISTVAARQLLVVMYENNRLFPRINSNDDMDVSSAVVGVKLVGIDVANLTEPVYVVLRASSLYHTTGSPRPVWWDQQLNNGSGGWNSAGCLLSYLLDGLLVFQCNRLAYFGLLQKIDYSYDESGKLFGVKFRFAHPAVYIGSLINVITLLAAIVSFVVCHASIQMSKRTKHSLVNTWAALALLSFMFALGIHQTEDIKVCQGIGLILHYLTLSVLLWMAVTVSNMYKRLTKSNSLHPPDDELPSEQPAAQKPLLGLYLVGWGIGLIVCGISGAVNIREYAGHTHCFLTPGPALSAVFVPAAMLILYLSVFYLLIRCSVRNIDTNGQLSEGTQATENVEIDLLDSGVNNLAMERVSLHSTSTPTASSKLEDPEYSPITQLRAHVIILILFLLTWGAAAIATATPFRDYVPYEESIFSVVYAILASCLGGFVVFFYCIARSDVRGELYLMQCWCRRKQGRCCRTRSISDTNPVIPAVQPLPANIVAVAGSNIISSRQSVNNSLSHHTDKTASTNKSINASKAAIELNSRIVKPDVSLKGKSNVNLVVLHRQQYRSNNSVTTYTEASGTSGAEMFYNPHQSTTARKFFRKQRRHLRQNNLGTRRSGDGGGADSVSDVVPAIYNQGLKVNNTNIHVESCVKEGRTEDFNIHVENSEDDAERAPPMERLVIGAEEVEAPVKSLFSIPAEVTSDSEEIHVEFDESDAVLASLEAEFQAIKDEMKQTEPYEVCNVSAQSPTPSYYSEDNLISGTNTGSGALDTNSCLSVEYNVTPDMQSLLELNSEITIPETCSFISNSDSRRSSEYVDSDSVERFNSESLLSLNPIEDEMIDIGISSPEMPHVRFRRNKTKDVKEHHNTRYCNNSPVSGELVLLKSDEFDSISHGKKESSCLTAMNNSSSEDESGADIINKKETSV